jgi:SpoVK/Ycf46/Vps4 family AAA+-type ATPase
MSQIPEFSLLKDIPSGFVYYIPFTKETIKIEPNIKDMYGNPVSYRIWINLNTRASLKKYSIYSLPIIKKKGDLISKYSLQKNSFNSLITFLLKYWKEEKALISLDNVKNELLKENSTFNFVPLYLNDFDNYIKIFLNSFSKQLNENSIEDINIYLNLQEISKLHYDNLSDAIFLEFQDFSKIKFNLKKPSTKDLELILKLLGDVGLSEEQEKKIFSYLELNYLLDAQPLKKEGKHGVVLYGPPGTGKTTTMRIFFKIFEILGCDTFEVKANNLISRAQVGAFAAEISKQIFEPAIKKIIQTRRPCLIYVDEATSLVSKPKDSSVSDWYQEGLDTIKNYLNRSKFPGIILCLATNANLSDLDSAIVGNDGRLEPIFFDFLDEKQFIILWENKLRTNLKIDEKTLSNWKSSGNIDRLSKICSKSVSGRFVANFCSTYREEFLDNDRVFGVRSIKERLLSGKNIVKDLYSQTIEFNTFYIDFLESLLKRFHLEIDKNIQEITLDHYFTIEERNSKIEEVKKKYSFKINQITSELSNLKNTSSTLGPNSTTLKDLDVKHTNLEEKIKTSLITLMKLESDLERGFKIYVIPKQAITLALEHFDFLEKHLETFLKEKSFFGFGIHAQKEQCLLAIRLLNEWLVKPYFPETKFNAIREIIKQLVLKNKKFLN